MNTRFRNRTEAGQALAAKLKKFKANPNAIVLALPRGGVPVAFEIASALKLPMEVFIVRKLGVPGQEELAFGAIASGDTVVFNDSIVNSLRIPEDTIARVIANARVELERRERIYRLGREPLSVRGRTVIIVDDGLATGATMHAAVAALRKMDPARIVVAVPVAAIGTCEAITKDGDTCVCAATPEPFYGVGMWYDDFRQTSDLEVLELLGRRSRNHSVAVAEATSGRRA